MLRSELFAEWIDGDPVAFAAARTRERLELLCPFGPCQVLLRCVWADVEIGGGGGYLSPSSDHLAGAGDLVESEVDPPVLGGGGSAFFWTDPPFPPPGDRAPFDGEVVEFAVA